MVPCLWCLWRHRVFQSYQGLFDFRGFRLIFLRQKSVNEASKGRLQSKPQRWYSPKTTNKLLSFFQRCLDATVIRYQFDKHFTCVSYSCNKINWCISKRLLWSMHTMDTTTITITTLCITTISITFTNRTLSKRSVLLCWMSFMLSIFYTDYWVSK
jgi:hypothetical protein